MQLVYFSVPAQLCWLKYTLGGAKGRKEKGKKRERELQEEKEEQTVGQASNFATAQQSMQAASIWPPACQQNYMG